MELKIRLFNLKVTAIIAAAGIVVLWWACMTNPLQSLQEVRNKLASLEQQELALISAIIAEAKHKKLGQKTYDLYGQKVTIKTAENSRLDKNILNAVWTEAMPINRSYAYTLRQKDYEAIMKSGSPAQRKQLAEIVTTSPAKPSVKIGE